MEALERLYDEGKVRAIGISNFYPDRMADLALFSRIKPMVNQVEIHPLNQNTELLEWASKYRIQAEAWAPFGEGRRGLFDHPVLKEIAEHHGKTTAQVMLRWNLQRGVVVIPKTVRKERMKENIDVFDFALSEVEMEMIKTLDTETSSFFSHRDPAMVEWFRKMVDERR
ncbi:MAG: aldo/keto reductase [Bullifex sp.]